MVICSHENSATAGYLLVHSSSCYTELEETLILGLNITVFDMNDPMHPQFVQKVVACA